MKQFKESNPTGRFWIKADAFDLKPVFQESVKGVWNGDVDMLDGKLMKLREEYYRRRILCKAENLRKERVFLETRLRALVTAVESDITFLTHGLTAAEQEYEKKFNAPNTSEELLKTLCWERVEFNTLLQQAQSFIGRCAECFDH